MRLLVSGASGFLGSEFLAAAAAEGHETVAFVRRRTRAVETVADEVICGDLLEIDWDQVILDLDAVVHFATATEGTPEAMTRASVEGTLRLFDFARSALVPRFVHISSMSVHGGPVRSADRLGVYELERRPQLRGAYALSKVRAEQALTAVAGERGMGMEIDICRPGLVFGREMQDPLAGTAVQLPLGLAVGLGCPGQGVPWTDLNDLNSALLGLLATKPVPGRTELYEILSQPVPSKRQLIQVMHSETGHPRRVVWIPSAVVTLAAICRDAVRRDRALRTTYGVRRLWRFDPRALDVRAIWKKAGQTPEASLSDSVRRAVTIRSDHEVPVDLAARARAEALLTIAQRDPVSRPARVVLVGAGRVVHEMHLPALAGLSGVSIEAVVDPRPGAAKHLADQQPVARAFRQLADVPDELLSGATAVIATPGITHAPLAEEAMERGASVVLEKPAVLGADQLEHLQRLELDGTRVTAIQNYRLRPPALALWRLLREHEVGPLVRVRVRFASPPLKLESARWMRDERKNRVLLYEMAIHFIDLAVQVAGRVTSLSAVNFSLSDDGARTNALTALGHMERCDDVVIDLDLAGTAPGVSLMFEFARAGCVLDFYPDAFRLLPRSPNPVDDVAASVARIGHALRHRSRRNRAQARAWPHRQIYAEHLSSVERSASSPAFGLANIADTIRSLDLLAEAAYAEIAAEATGVAV